MIIIKTRSLLRKYVKSCRSGGGKIGFVPTMGALHEGHIELVRQAKQGTDTVVASIFVNPTQFNDPKDFQKYPVTIEKDILALEAAGTDLLFLPAVQELYPDGTLELEHYELGYLETILEGFYRPGHFQGVCQVMKRLLDAVDADRLFMGQKDYQQCMVVKRLLHLMGSHTELITCPTVREADGLAMSSRNKRLTTEQRARAIGIYKALQRIQDLAGKKGIATLKQDALRILEDHQFRTDYVEIADGITLQPVSEWSETQKPVALIAAFQDEVRLIDNIIINS